MTAQRRDIFNGSATEYQHQAAYRYQDAQEAFEAGCYSYGRVSMVAAAHLYQWARESMKITDSDQEYA